MISGGSAGYWMTLDAGFYLIRREASPARWITRSAFLSEEEWGREPGLGGRDFPSRREALCRLDDYLRLTGLEGTQAGPGRNRKRQFLSEERAAGQPGQRG